jgi:hypothetical protein
MFALPPHGKEAPMRLTQRGRLAGLLALAVLAGLLTITLPPRAVSPASTADNVAGGFAASGLVADVGSGVGLVTLTSWPARAGDEDGAPVYAVQTAPQPWLGEVPRVVWVRPGLTGVALEDLQPGSRWYVRVDQDLRLATQMFPVRDGQLRLTGQAAERVVDDVDGGDPAVLDVDKLKAKIK